MVVVGWVTGSLRFKTSLFSEKKEKNPSLDMLLNSCNGANNAWNFSAPNFGVHKSKSTPDG